MPLKSWEREPWWGPVLLKGAQAHKPQLASPWASGTPAPTWRASKTLHTCSRSKRSAFTPSSFSSCHDWDRCDPKFIDYQQKSRGIARGILHPEKIILLQFMEGGSYVMFTLYEWENKFQISKQSDREPNNWGLGVFHWFNGIFLNSLKMSAVFLERMSWKTEKNVFPWFYYLNNYSLCLRWNDQ